MSETIYVCKVIHLARTSVFVADTMENAQTYVRAYMSECWPNHAIQREEATPPYFDLPYWYQAVYYGPTDESVLVQIYSDNIVDETIVRNYESEV